MSSRQSLIASRDLVPFNASVSGKLYLVFVSFMNLLNELITSYTKTQRQKAAQIGNQLNRLQQQLASQLLTIHEQESEFIASQENILGQIRPLLALDARSLLSVDEFEQFVRSLLQNIAAAGIQSTLSLQISPNPSKWTLNTLPTPLQIRTIEVIASGNSAVSAGGIRVQVDIGNWQQILFIPMSESQSSWLAIAQQMQEKVVDLPITTDSQEGLMQELVILFAYVGSLFWIDHLANQHGIGSVLLQRLQ